MRRGWRITRSRPQQLEMAEAVARAIAAKRHLVAEAGTGVGKSFAYLVPAILAATEREARSRVSPRLGFGSFGETALRGAEDRRLDAHDQLAGAAHRQGLAAAQRGDSARVLGRARERAAQLSQPAAARSRARPQPKPVQRRRAARPAPTRFASGASRQPTARSAISASSRSGRCGTKSASDSGNCLGRRCPTLQPMLLLQGSPPRAERADPGGQSRAVVQRHRAAPRRRQHSCRITTS